MNRNKLKKPGLILKSFLPALVTGGIMLTCATAPMLTAIPERLAWTPPSAAAQTSEATTENPTVETQNTETETTAPSEMAHSQYEDGRHLGVGTGFGGEIKAAVTVEQGRIVEIEILSAPGETKSFFARAKAVTERIVAAQTWEVDAVSGATYSSDGIKAAVKNALTGEETAQPPARTERVSGNPRALTEVSFNPPKHGYQDGIFTGSAQGFGGLITVRVTIADGKLTDVAVLSAPGETPAYLSRARAVLSAILQAQSPKVDAVSGATYSSRGLINAVKNALRRAGDSTSATEEETEPTPETERETEPEPSQTEPDPTAVPGDGAPDGVYLGTGTGFGGTIKVAITLRDGRIQSIEILEAAYETPAFLASAEAVVDRILAAQSAEVDAVAGATYSSNGIKEAVVNALAAANAAAANPDPTEPEPTDPSPTEPEPTDPSPTEPEPTDSSPTEPEPTDSSPTKPEPTDPSPTEPEPTDPEPSTPEEETETYVGTAMVVADEEEAFWDYEIVLTVTVSVKRTTTETDGQRETVAERTVTDVSIHADTDVTNLAFLNRAFGALKPLLLQGSDELDAISGATCSSNGIREAWKQAMQGVVLGKTVETTAP